MVYVSSKGGGNCHNIFFLNIYLFIYFYFNITVSLYRRKFYDGHIMLVFVSPASQTMNSNYVTLLHKWAANLKNTQKFWSN